MPHAQKKKKKNRKNGAGFRLAHTFRNTLNFLGVITHHFESCAVSLTTCVYCVLFCWCSQFLLLPAKWTVIIQRSNLS